MKRWLVAVIVAALVAPAAAAWATQDFTVRITVRLANVRTGPSLSSEVVTQVTGGTVLTLRRIEGDWFRVVLPPTPDMNGAQVEAYVSNTVAVVQPVQPTAPPAPAPEPQPAEPEPEDEDEAPASAESLVPRRDGMAVALQIGISTAWLSPEPTTLSRLAADVRSVPDLVRQLLAVPEGTPPASGPVTFAWPVESAAAGQIVHDRRPSFVAVFSEVPGVRPEDVEPFIVRLSPVGGVARAVASVRADVGRIDDREMSWDLMDDLVQAEVRVTRQAIERGALRLQPSGELEPGEYAVVMRPRDGWRISGANVLRTMAEGRLFGWAWGFSVRPATEVVAPGG